MSHFNYTRKVTSISVHVEQKYLFTAFIPWRLLYKSSQATLLFMYMLNTYYC